MLKSDSFQVPVPTRVYKTRLVPTRQDLDKLEKVTRAVIKNTYHPELITTTVHEPILDLQTVYKQVTVTKQNPVIATVDKHIPVIVTQTEFSQVVQVVVDTEVVVVQDVVPVLSTQYEIVHNEVRNTKVVPIDETVYDTKVVYKNICGNKQKGYY